VEVPPLEERELSAVRACLGGGDSLSESYADSRSSWVNEPLRRSPWGLEKRQVRIDVQPRGVRETPCVEECGPEQGAAPPSEESRAAVTPPVKLRERTELHVTQR
jgi:hypothetical protein